MERYVALLRGINVGGNNIIPMADLRAVCTQLGFHDVKTYINSGNIIFGSGHDDISHRLEKAIEAHFGFHIDVAIITASALGEVVEALPKTWVTDAVMRTEVLFYLESGVGIPKINPHVDRIIEVQHALIWNIDRRDVNISGFTKIVGTSFYKKVTARNANTVRKLYGLVRTE